MAVNHYEYDSVDVVPISLEGLQQNIAFRIKAYEPEVQNLFFTNPKVRIQYDGIILEGTRLHIRKTGFSTRQYDFYKMVSGVAEVSIEQTADGLLFKTRILPSIMAVKVLCSLGAALGTSIAISIFAMSGHWGTFLFLMPFWLAIYVTYKIIKQELKTALTQYYKAFLLNIVNT